MEPLLIIAAPLVAAVVLLFALRGRQFTHSTKRAALTIGGLTGLLLATIAGYVSWEMLLVAGGLGAVTANQVLKRQAGDRQKYPVAASTTIYEATLCFIAADGYLEDDTASGANPFAGIAVEQVDNSAGADNALSAELYISGVFRLVGSSFSQADVGKVVFATDNYTITTTPTEAGVPIGVCREYISSTVLAVEIMGEGAAAKVCSISESLAFGDFTDGGATTGYKDWSCQLPAGAIPLGVKYVVATGFTGDTTAVVQTGVSGDVDRFSSVTDQSVLAAATVGHGVAADACDGINAAQTIRTTVTGAADFTSISAGAMVATLYYLKT